MVSRIDGPGPVAAGPASHRKNNPNQNNNKNPWENGEFDRGSSIEPPDPPADIVGMFGARRVKSPTPPNTEPLFDVAEASIGAMLDTEPPERRYLLDGVLPLGVLGLLAAGGGTGKTMAILQMAVSVAAGLPFWGLSVSEPGGVLVLAAEDDKTELWRRLWRIVEHLRERGALDEAAEELLRERLFIVSRVGVDSRITVEEYRQTIRTPVISRLAASIEELPGLSLVVLDPLNRFRGGDENCNDGAVRFIETVETLHSVTEAAIVLPHHVSKDGVKAGTERMGAEMLRGASGLIDGARWAAVMATMRRDAAEKYRVPAAEAGRYVRFDIIKNNYGPPWGGMWLHRGAGGILEPVSLEANDTQATGEEYRHIIQTVRAILSREGPMSCNQLRIRYAGKKGQLAANEKTVVKALKRAIDDGHFIERIAGRGSLICNPDPDKNRE